jgi:hypothetical protein
MKEFTWFNEKDSLLGPVHSPCEWNPLLHAALKGTDRRRDSISAKFLFDMFVSGDFEDNPFSKMA